LGYIGIVQHKEHSPQVLSIPPGTPCINLHFNFYARLQFLSSFVSVFYIVLSCCVSFNLRYFFPSLFSSCSLPFFSTGYLYVGYFILIFSSLHLPHSLFLNWKSVQSNLQYMEKGELFYFFPF